MQRAYDLNIQRCSLDLREQILHLFAELALRKLPAEGAKQTAIFFDTVNIARNIRCPIHLSVGFIDRICPPDSIYALYNSLTQEKTIANVVTGEHGPVIDPKEKSVFIQNMEYLDRRFLKKKSGKSKK